MGALLLDPICREGAGQNTHTPPSAPITATHMTLRIQRLCNFISSEIEISSPFSSNTTETENHEPYASDKCYYRKLKQHNYASPEIPGLPTRAALSPERSGDAGSSLSKRVVSQLCEAVEFPESAEVALTHLGLPARVAAPRTLCEDNFSKSLSRSRFL